MAHVIGSLLLLGASGDLSGRLLLPAFGQLLDREESRQDVVLIGAGVEDSIAMPGRSEFGPLLHRARSPKKR